jgi:hypothetical protein
MRPENRIFDQFPGRFSREKYLRSIVCPFAKEHLAHHLELKEHYAVAAQASTAENES